MKARFVAIPSAIDGFHGEVVQFAGLKDGIARQTLDGDRT
jgi:hypothetical protein